MTIIGAQPLSIAREPDGRLGVLGHREKQISIFVIFDLSDGPFVAMQHQRLLEKKYS